MHDDEVTEMPGRCQKCNNDPCRCPPPDPYRFGSTTSTTCARCSHTFTSRTDGFVDEALEIEVAAHQERCFVAGDYVYVDTPSISGTGVVTGLVAPGLAAIKMDERGKHYEAGTRLAFGTCTLRRIPRPQHGEALGVSTLHCQGITDGKQCRETTLIGTATKLPWRCATHDACTTYVGNGDWCAFCKLGPSLHRKAQTVAAPAPVLYDGRTAESCCARWSDNRSIVERGGLPLYELTPDQIAEAKRQYASVAAVTWSRILRNRLAASAEADRCRVRVDDQSEP